MPRTHLAQPVFQRPDLAHPLGRERVVVHRDDPWVLRRGLLDQLPGAVSGPAVHDQRLQHRGTLLAQPGQARPDAVRFVEAGDHDGHAADLCVTQDRVDRGPAGAARQQADDQDEGRQPLQKHQCGERGRSEGHGANVADAGSDWQGEHPVESRHTFVAPVATASRHRPFHSNRLLRCVVSSRCPPSFSPAPRRPLPR
jgi:hypothetical protein